MHKNCPWCGREGGAELGTLGLLRWFRCIYCGGQFKQDVKIRGTKTGRRAAV